MKCFVYFIHDKGTGAIKIGVAKDVEERRLTFQTASSSELETCAIIEHPTRSQAFNKEAFFHKEFEVLHVRGEWFDQRVLVRLLEFTELQWKHEGLYQRAYARAQSLLVGSLKYRKQQRRAVSLILTFIKQNGLPPPEYKNDPRYLTDFLIKKGLIPNKLYTTQNPITIAKKLGVWAFK